MNGVEWYWNIKLPKHFICEHPIGTVLGRAAYGDYLCVYQGVTVGAGFRGKECIWPVIGKNVVCYSNSSILGDCQIGKNVIFSANSFVMNERIPDNCIVFGSSPEIVIKKMDEDAIYDRLVRIWNREKCEWEDGVEE